jgi:hypothetical protein
MPSLEDLTTDQLLARAREMEPNHQLLAALLSNRETREVMQRALKKVNPKLVIPEIDAKDEVRGEIKEQGKKIESLEHQLLERDVRDRIERQRASVKSKYKLSDAELLEVEKLMVLENPDERIPTYEAAAKVYRASTTPAQPTPATFMPPTYSMPEKEVWGPGIGSKAKLDKIGLEQAFSAFNDILQGKVAGLGPARVQ